MEKTLKNRIIAVPETRQLDVLSGLLERRGAEVVRCPLVGIHDAPDPVPVLAWIDAFINNGADDLVLLTGEGLRRLLSCIKQHCPEKEALFIERLAGVRKIVRGPKPNKALRELGLAADVTALSPTTEGIIETLKGFDLCGRTVAVQLYGVYENPPLMDALTTFGATALPVFPYVYADEAEADEVAALVQRLIADELDAITFTSQPQIRRLILVAKKAGCVDELIAALNRCTVAAVGPVMGDALRERGIHVKVEPQGSFFMKPLVRALEQELS